MTDLNDRLGFSSDDRVLIISCDDFGLTHSSNEGVVSALRNGVATCASIMVPAPWARHAAQLVTEGDDIGVHLTLNAEHDCYRFGPLTHAPSLLSGDGGFPSAIDDLWEHADPAEVRRELRTQVTRAEAWGIDVTHLAPHLSAITLRPEFFDAYLDVAVEFQLPIRLPSTVTASEAGFPFRTLALDEGVLFPDFFDHDWRAGSRQRVLDAIEQLSPGVTELHLQPALDTPEIRALTADAAGWIDDHQFLLEPQVREVLETANVHLIGYRELRSAMRA
jgi:chitin disaccharide deacetylase